MTDLREKIASLPRYRKVRSEPGYGDMMMVSNFGGWLSREAVLDLFDAHTAEQPAPDAVAEAPVDQEAFGDFEVRCKKCGSLHVEWFNDMGWSAMSGGWGSAGFRCRDCETTTDMVEA